MSEKEHTMQRNRVPAVPILSDAAQKPYLSGPQMHITRHDAPDGNTWTVTVDGWVPRLAVSVALLREADPFWLRATGTRILVRTRDAWALYRAVGRAVGTDQWDQRIYCDLVCHGTHGRDLRRTRQAVVRA